VALPAAAGITVEDRPVSPIRANAVMGQCVPCVRLADLARALGVTPDVDFGASLGALTPNPDGVPTSNPVRHAAFGMTRRPRRPPAGRQGPSKAEVAPGVAAGRNAATPRSGADVVFDELETALPRPTALMPLPECSGRFTPGE
jgi:hypothetical protein